MKILLNSTLTILILLAIADMFMWLVANDSGHNIPDKTNSTFIIAFLGLVFPILINLKFLKHSDKRKKKSAE